MTEKGDGPVYLALCMDDLAKSPKDLYKSVKDVSKFVNSPEGKTHGARFKKFGTPKEALDFLAAGDVLSSPKPSTKNALIPEPGSPFPSVNKIEMNEFKKYVEKGDMHGFLKLVDLNPRYLVNIGGDVAAIVMEGFRYNALHIAAKSGQIEIVKKILELIRDKKFLFKLYGAEEKNVMLRKSNIMKSYLNTPDKGNCDTPCHFAAKFGKLSVLEELVKQPYLDKNVRNKAGKTIYESICERYHEPDRAEIAKKMQLALNGIYVVLTRNFDDVATLTISFKFVTEQSKYSKTCAIAGPFEDENSAQKFRSKWLTMGKELKKTDAEKGYEKVGRLLCQNESAKTGWYEYWSFLGKESLPVDITNHYGLELLENFLKGKQRKDNLIYYQFSAEKNSKAFRMRENPIKVKPLNFNILDDSVNDNWKNPEYDENDDNIFYDAMSDLDRYSEISDNSFTELSNQFAALSFASSNHNKCCSNFQAEHQEEKEDEHDEDDEFVTPSSSPPPTYFFGTVPSKMDNELFEVLSKVPCWLLSKYPMIQRFLSKLEKLNETERQKLPGVDTIRRTTSMK